MSLLGAVNSCLNTSPCPWDGHVTPHPSSRCLTSLSLQGTGQQQRKRFAGSSTEVSGFRRAVSVRFACSSSLRGSTRSSLHCRCSSEMERSCECREELRDASVAAAEQCCSAHTQLGTAHHSWVLAQAGDGPQPRTSHGHPCIGSWVQAGYRLGTGWPHFRVPGSLPKAASSSTCLCAQQSRPVPCMIGAIPINTELLVPPACCEPRRPSLGFTSPRPLPAHSTCLVAPGPPPPGHTALSGHSAHVSPAGRGAELSPQPHAVSRHIPATPPARRCAPCSQGTAAELTPAPEGSAGRKAAA